MNCDFMFSIEQFFISAESLTGPLWSNSKKTRQFFGTSRYFKLNFPRRSRQSASANKVSKLVTYRHFFCHCDRSNA